jgi:hypothetical protein
MFLLRVVTFTFIQALSRLQHNKGIKNIDRILTFKISLIMELQLIIGRITSQAPFIGSHPIYIQTGAPEQCGSAGKHTVLSIPPPSTPAADLFGVALFIFTERLVIDSQQQSNFLTAVSSHEIYREYSILVSYLTTERCPLRATVTHSCHKLLTYITVVEQSGSRAHARCYPRPC